MSKMNKLRNVEPYIPIAIAIAFIIGFGVGAISYCSHMNHDLEWDWLAIINTTTNIILTGALVYLYWKHVSVYVSTIEDEQNEESRKKVNRVETQSGARLNTKNKE